MHNCQRYASVALYDPALQQCTNSNTNKDLIEPPGWLPVPVPELRFSSLKSLLIKYWTLATTTECITVEWHILQQKEDTTATVCGFASAISTL